MATHLRKLLSFYFLIHICVGHRGKFTTMTNLEKLFTIESEIISWSDVLIREEHFAHQGEENPHDLSNITRMVSEAKDIHRNISSVSEYLSHPVNVLHLTRRLQTRWPATLKAFWESEPCQKWKLPQFRSRIANMWNNLPNRDNFKTVTLSIANIMYTEKVHFKDLQKGLFFGQRSHQPVTFSDIWEVTLAAYNDNMYSFTASMVEGLFELCKSSRNVPQCEGTSLYKIASGAYYKMHNLEKAISMTKKILKQTPDNTAEKRNLKFYEKRLKIGSAGDESPVPAHSRFYNTCRGDRRKSPGEARRLKCVMLPTLVKFVYEKAEYHNLNPPVIEFHAALERIFLDTMKQSAAKKTKEQHVGSRYSTPEVTHLPYKTYLYKQFSKRFLKLEEPLTHPISEGDVQVRQTGMEGMYGKDRNRRGERDKTQKKNGHVGSFYTLLNSDYLGGEFVFPKLKVRITPVKGNTVFFFSTKSTLSICPVAYGVQWITMQPLYEQPISKTCRIHDQDLWDGKSRK